MDALLSLIDITLNAISAIAAALTVWEFYQTQRRRRAQAIMRGTTPDFITPLFEADKVPEIRDEQELYGML